MLQCGIPWVGLGERFPEGYVPVGVPDGSAAVMMERRGFLAVFAAIVAGPRLLWRRHRVHALMDARLTSRVEWGHSDYPPHNYVVTWDVDAADPKMRTQLDVFEEGRWVEVASVPAGNGRAASNRTRILAGN